MYNLINKFLNEIFILGIYINFEFFGEIVIFLLLVEIGIFVIFYKNFY